MRLQDLALASARVAIASDKASDELRALLDKWFAKHLVKGIKLTVLRAMHTARTLDTFIECLSARPEVDVIGILRKVDAQNSVVLSRSRAEMLAHIRALASGEAEPARKAKAAGRAKPSGKPQKAKDPGAKAPSTGGVYERSRL